jgi:hypothetical protein
MNLAVAISGQIRTFPQTCAALDAMFRAVVGAEGTVDYFGAFPPEDAAWVTRWPWTAITLLVPQYNPEIRGLPVFHNLKIADPEQMIWRQLQSTAAVGALVRQVEEARGGRRYDWVCRCRTDLVFERPMEPLAEVDPDGIYAVAHDNWSGINDRFAFGPSALMEHYFRFGESIYRHFAQPVTEAASSRNSENILRRHLEALKIPRRYTRAIIACLRTDGTLQRPNWRPDHHDAAGPDAPLPGPAPVSAPVAGRPPPRPALTSSEVTDYRRDVTGHLQPASTIRAKP